MSAPDCTCATYAVETDMGLATAINHCPLHEAARDMYEALEELEAYWSNKRTRWAGIEAQVGAALYEARGRKEAVLS